MRGKIKKIIFISIIFILMLILIFLFHRIYKNVLNKKNFENGVIRFSENNKETIFSINKMIFFSSCDSKSKSSSASNFTIQNLYTYTDMVLFINNNSEENTLENTLKNVRLTNVKISKEPVVGKPNLYYKSAEKIANSDFEESNIIDKEIEFDVTSEDIVDLNKPILYNNCANPITLSYVNQYIKNDYTMTDTENPITYNGKLLERCGISINSIDASISFDIEIENNKNQKYKTTVYLDIPYEDKEKSIYDGNLMIKRDTNFVFYRYE